jgi:formylmethanofuran dehydrogenase subunit E/alpha-acetolactate decarboxylase
MHGDDPVGVVYICMNGRKMNGFKIPGIGFLQGHGLVQSAGKMSEMGSTGFAPAISMDSLQKYSHIYGMGPLGRMQGEITFAEGVPYSGYTDLGGKAYVQENWDIESLFFVYEKVEEWIEIPLEDSIADIADLEKRVEAVATDNGIDLKDPFFFKLVGTFDEMVTHIVTPRSADVEGFKPGRNQQEYQHEGESGEIIGVYSQVGRDIYTHQNSNIHVHFIKKDKSFTAHLDKIQTSLNGVDLLLPISKNELHFTTNDTEYSKGRLGFQQGLKLNDLVKFHGHLCDGLVVGAMGLNLVFNTLFPEGVIDRTDLRVVSESSQCLTDAAVYLTGARYQFGTFYVDNAIEGIYTVQKISDGQTYQVSLKAGIKPDIIDEMGSLAVNKALTGCELDKLKDIEDDFIDFLMKTDAREIFHINRVEDFEWQPVLKGDFIKTDILNKTAANCTH